MSQGAYELTEQGGVVRDNDGRMVVTQAGGSTTAIAAATVANTVVKGSPGMLLRVLVTTAGTTAMSFYDNATTNAGTIIGMVPANATAGSFYLFQMPAANGITAAGAATNPAVTVSVL